MFLFTDEAAKVCEEYKLDCRLIGKFLVEKQVYPGVQTDKQKENLLMEFIDFCSEQSKGGSNG